MGGKKNWYVVDGYRPEAQPVKDPGYEGHECIMILNTNEVDAHVNISVYFTDKPAVEDIEIIVPAKRILAFRSSEKEYFGGLELGINEQYSLAFHSDVEIVVQYGRMNVQQSNLAYIGMMGYSE